MVVIVHPQCQTAFPLKPLGQSKTNFMLASLGKGNVNLYKWSRLNDQDGRHVHGKTFKKNFFSRRGSPMILKIGMQHQRLKLYKVYINDDPGFNLTYFTARSNWVVYTFEWGKLFQSYLMGKTCSKD